MQKRLVRIANAILDLEPFKPDTIYSRYGDTRADTLRLDQNESGIGPTPAAIEAITDFVKNRPLNRYPDRDALELRVKLSEYAALPSEYISCYAGADLALEHIFRTYLEAGTELVVGGPVKKDTMITALSTGARFIEAEHENVLEPAIENVVNRVTSRTRAIYIGNPGDLTGGHFSEAELVFLLAYSEKTMVIIDEEYFEYSGRSMAGLVGRFPNLTIVRSFSKGFGLASLRAAYILSDPENLRFIHRIKGENGPDSIAQIAALAALENLDYTREHVVGIDQSKKTLSNSLLEIGYESRITQANFILMRVSSPESAIVFLRNNGIYARDLSNISQLAGYLRITIGTPEQTDRLLLTLSRMAEQQATGYNRNKTVAGENRIKKESKKTVEMV